MLAHVIIEAVENMIDSTQSVQYLSALAKHISTKSTELAKLNKQKRENIGYTLTGMHILSDARLRESAHITEQEGVEILSSIKTNPVSASKLITIGKRLPSISSKYFKYLSNADRLSQDQRRGLIFDLNRIATNLRKLRGSAKPDQDAHLT